MTTSTQLGGPPTIGLLSRTLLPSPSIKWIVPARLRSFTFQKDKIEKGAYIDVAFVGDHTVALREYQPACPLFPPDKRDPNDKNEKLTEKLSLTDDGFDDHLIDLHLQVSFRPRIIAVKSFKNPIAGLNFDEKGFQRPPPEILALVLDSKDLLFLMTSTNSKGKLRFVCARRPLPGPSSESERFGKHLAVDPRSRLLAVASSRSHVGLFVIKYREELQNHDGVAPLHFDEETQLIREERFLDVEGIILKMDFLHPAKNSNPLVHLLLIVRKKQQTHCIMYTWNTNQNLNHIAADPQHTRLLAVDEDLPLLLIPSSWPTSFILVFKDSLKLFNIPQKGSRNHKTYRIGDANQGQLWVQWQKSVRRDYYLQNSDDFYLCREDGLLQYFEVSVKPELDIQLHFKLSDLEGCRVDSAFALLSTLDATGEPSKHDVVLVGGDLTDGGFYGIDASSEARRKQKFPNWAPIRDFRILGEDQPVVEDETPRSSYFNRLLVVGGNVSQDFSKAPRSTGRLSLLEHAFEADIILRVNLEADSNDSGSLVDSLLADKLWVLEDRPHLRHILLISTPERTLIIQFPFVLQEGLDADEWSDLNLVSEAPTLAAGSDGETCAIQVTRDGIKILLLSNSTQYAVDGPSIGPLIIAAAVNESARLVLVATKTPSTVQLRSYEISNVQQSPPMQQIAAAMDIPYDPKSLLITCINDRVVAFVGLHRGILEVYEILPGEKFSPMCSQNLNSVTTGFEEDSIDSIILLRPPAVENLIVLCGMRNGWLVCTTLQIKNGSGAEAPEIIINSRHRLGLTSVTLVPDTKRLGATFAICELKTFLIEADETGYVRDPLIAPLILHNRSESPEHERQMTKREPQRIQAIASISNLFELYYEDGDPQKERKKAIDIEGTRGLTVCVTDKELKFCRLSIGAKGMPEQSFIDSNPTCLAYSKTLQKFIAGVEKVTFEGGRRAVRPSFVTFQLNHLESSFLDTLDANTTFGKSGEKVSHMMVWRPILDDKKHELLVIASNSGEGGRIVFFKIRDAKKHGPELSRSTAWSFPEHVVHRLAPFGETSLLFGVGDSLVIQKLEKEKKQELRKDVTKWRYVCEYTLPSPAVGIAVFESLVYVTTERHSLQVLKITDDERFVFVESAPMTAGNMNLLQAQPALLKLDRAMTSPTSILLPWLESSVHGPPVLMSSGTALSCFNLGQELRQVLDPAYTPTNQRYSTTDNSPFCNVLFQSELGYGLNKMEHVSSNTVYGTTLDGTLLQLTLLNERELELLKFLGDLMSQDAGGSGFQRVSLLEHWGHKRKHRSRFEEDKHINGDTLLDLLDATHEDIERLLASRPREQFHACARAVVGDKDDYKVAVMKWLWRVLQPRLKAYTD